MRRSPVSRVRAALLLAAGLFLVVAPLRGEAACHSFTVSVSPATVTEGGSATVTVTRDGAVAPSNVDVVSVNETAKAGQDYPAVSRTVSFTTDTQQTFSISTTNDSTHESSETFRLHLQNAGGCPVATSFDYGADARVTIKDNDAAPSPTQSQSAQPTSSSSPRATQSPSLSPSASPSASPTQQPSPLPSQTPSDTPTVPEPTSTSLATAPGDGGSGGRLGLMITGGVLLAGAAFVFAALRRSRPQL